VRLVVALVLALSPPLASALSPARPCAQQSAVLPAGFALERAAARTGSFESLAFDERGGLYAGAESGPIARIADEDGDGFFEKDGVFCEEVHDAQGLVWKDGVLFAVGTREGRLGVYRITPDATRLRAERVELVCALDGGGEHGAHGIAVGPDGSLYVAIGNEARLHVPDTRSITGYEGNLLPTLDDPQGFGASTSWPYGVVARVDPKSGAATLHSVGYRNHYDLAFDAEGELFTCDSDMEYDLGLPWYRPVRVLHCVPLADYGSRRGSGTWPAEFPDTLPGVADVGRGSPTGLVFYGGRAFPARWRGALFVGDWADGRILAVHLAHQGASYSGTVETFASGTSIGAITDLAEGRDGALYFVAGGRGIVGQVQRIAWRGETSNDDPVAPPRTCAIPRANVRVDASRAAGSPASTADAESVRAALASNDPLAQRRACEEIAFSSSIDASSRTQLMALLGAEDRFVRHAARSALERLDRIEPGALGLLVPDLLRDPEAGNAAQLRRLIEGALLLARAHPPGVSAHDVARPLLDHVLGLSTDFHPDADVKLAALRALELVVLRIGEIDDPLRRSMSWQGLALRDERTGETGRMLARELATLAAHWNQPSAVDQILAAIGRESDRAQRIAGLDRLRCTTRGFRPEQAARAFACAEDALRAGGGASYAGYVEAMRDAILARLDVREVPSIVVGAARSEDPALRIGPRTLAWIASRLDGDAARPVLAELRAAWDRIEPKAAGGSGGPGEAERTATIAALAGARSDDALAWLREIARGDAPEHRAALVSLARTPQAEDLGLFAAGLGDPAYGVPEACSKALLAIAARPSDAATWTAALDLAHRYGHPRGWSVLLVLAHWAGEPAPIPNPDTWAPTVQALEAAFARRFPDARREPIAASGPRWELERVLGFLQKSAARQGSAARGARMFERASCARCHVAGTETAARAISAGTAGPDLTGVARRFDDAKILESVYFPSRAISDQYRTSLVETTDETRLEGRIRRDDEHGIEIVLADGTTRTIERAEIAAVRLSKVSAMPEGLLAESSPEEIKDLLAFLHDEFPTDGVAGSAAGENDWTTLFKGAQRGGWDGDPSLWKLDHGMLVGRAKNLERGTYIVSRATYDDFELAFDVWVTKGGNSGAQYRSRVDPLAEDPIGYQADVGQIFWGSLYATDGRGMLHDADPVTWRKSVVIEGWNHYWMRVEGDRHVIEVNGVTMTDVRDDRWKLGILGFQLHKGLEMEVRVANALIRRLQ
jgi:putative heme-binding domain-containing protein